MQTKTSPSITLASLLSLLLFLVLLLVAPGKAAQCGSQAEGRLCPGNFCCSEWGYCGSTEDYCGEGCQSQCWSPPPPFVPPPPGPPPPAPGPTPGGDSELAKLLPRELFEEILLHRNNIVCPARGFYTYEAFLAAAVDFPEFASTGNDTIKKREIAAFLAQTSHETTGGWDDAPDGRYSWGYCFKAEVGGEAGPDYCDRSAQWPCVPGKKYFGRGPMQLSYNYNYGQAGEALGLDLLSNPELVETDPVISFKTALWFWMTPQPPKPSCHAVMTDQWTPTPADLAANRIPGFGVTTNIINGGLECGGVGPDPRVEDRIGFYKRYCDIFDVSYWNKLDCYLQSPFGNSLVWSII